MAFSRPRIMPDGTIVYPRRGWEPPPSPGPDYRRKSENPRSPDAWIFVPEWQPCSFQVIVEKVRPCGAITVTATCNLKRITTNKMTCLACKDRV